MTFFSPRPVVIEELPKAAGARLRGHWLDPHEHARWDEFAAKHPCGLIFHQSSWKRALENSFPQMRGRYLVLSDEEGAIHAGLAVYRVRSWLLGNRLVSIPFATLADPLTNSGSDLQQSTSLLVQQCGLLGASRIELRCFRNLLSETSGEWRRDLSFKQHFIRLDLQPAAALYQKFSRTAIRRMVSRAEQSGIVPVQGENEEHLQRFYEVFVQCRRVLALPPIPYAFFRELWRCLPRDRIFLSLAVKEGKVLGAVLGLVYKEVFSLEYSGELPEARCSGAGQLLYWNAIQHAYARGCAIFHFGRTHRTNAGLLQYKRHWATTESDLPVYRWPARSAQSSSSAQAVYKMTQLLCRAAPDWIYPYIGHCCYRHLG
ncbi:MAG: GNAT family N-acetyltransferase [Verrucomicrobiota bacterium]